MSEQFSKEQLEAIRNDGQSVLISAGAGSGKTSVLGARVLFLMREKEIPLSRMLILTFTNDAAFNMRERIKQNIREQSVIPQSEVNNVDSCDIVTFDSYINSLATKYSYLLGLEDGFQVLDGNFAKIKTSEIIDQYIKELFDKKDERVYKFADNYCEDTIDNLKSIITKVIEQEKLLTSFDYRNNFVNDTLSKSALDKLYNEELNILQSQLKENYDNLINLFNEQKNSSISYKTINNIFKRYIDLNDSSSYLSKTYDNFDDFADAVKHFKVPSNPFKTSKGEEEIEISKYARDQFINIQQIVNQVNSTIPQSILEEDVENIKNSISFILDCVKNISNKIFEFKKSINAYEFSDFSRMVINLLKTNKDVREEISNSYDEIMVDEYQDNNDLQEDFINCLEKNNLFLVGDIKQSIYKFRNANPSLFLARYNKYINNENVKDGKLIAMSANYRSSNVVIDFINSIFKIIMVPEFGGIKYNTKEHLLANGNQSFNVYNKKECTIFTPDKNNIYLYDVSKEKNDCHISSEDRIYFEANFTAKKIKDIVENSSYYTLDKKGNKVKVKFSDFAVILDRKSKFDKIIKIFNDNNVPIDNRANDKVTGSIPVLIISNVILLTYHFYVNDLISNDFKHYFYSVARSFIYNLDDDVIYNLLSDETKMKQSKIYIDFISAIKNQRFNKPYAIILEVFRNINFVDNIHTTDSPEAYMNVYNFVLNNLLSLDSLSLNFDTIKDYFIQFKDEESDIEFNSNTQANDAVTLINIHKSKGLEYKYIFFLGNHVNYFEKEASKRENKIILPKLGSKPRFDFSLSVEMKKKLYKEKKYSPEIINGLRTPNYFLIKKDELDASRQEKIRLLYVALTRAKFQCNLFLATPGKDTKLEDCKSFEMLLNLVKSYSKANIEEIDFVKYIDPLKKKKSRDLVENKQNKIIFDIKDNYIQRDDSYIKSASKGGVIHVDKSVVEFGNKIHKYLSIIDFKNINLNFITDNKIRKIIEDFLSIDLIKFNLKQAQFLQEYTYFDKQSNAYNSIDLLILLENKAIILDYKLKNISDDEYKLQLSRYEKNVKEIFNVSTIDKYLYSLIDRKLQKIN